VVRTTPRLLYPRERPGTHCTGGWVSPRAGLDLCEKSRPHRNSMPDCPGRSKSLYRLSYPAYKFTVWKNQLNLKAQRVLCIKADRWNIIHALHKQRSVNSVFLEFKWVCHRYIRYIDYAKQKCSQLYFSADSSLGR
jgi:hypothetical protein